MRLTLNNINAAIKEAGLPGQLFRGKDYFYMADTGDDEFWCRQYGTMILAAKLNCGDRGDGQPVDIDWWVGAVRILAAQ